MKNLVLLLVLAIPLGAYQAQSAGSKDSSSYHTHKPTNQTQNGLNSPSASSIEKAFNGPVPKSPDQSIKPDPPPNSPEWVNFLNAVSTAIIALFTILLFVAVAWQIRASKQSERSWIAIRRIGTLPENWFDDARTKGYVPGFIAEFEVYGKTVVRVIESRFYMRIVPTKQGKSFPLEPDLPEVPDYEKPSRYQIAGENRMVIPPQAPFNLQAFLEGDVIKEFENLRGGKKLMCAYGVVRYRDAFDKDRETRACYVYDFAWGGVLSTPDGQVLNPAGFRIAGPSEYNKAT
jgi:hypothetical protein